MQACTVGYHGMAGFNLFFILRSSSVLVFVVAQVQTEGGNRSRLFALEPSYVFAAYTTIQDDVFCPPPCRYGTCCGRSIISLSE